MVAVPTKVVKKIMIRKLKKTSYPCFPTPTQKAQDADKKEKEKKKKRT